MNAPLVLGADVIARIAHEVNRAYCAGLGDCSQVAWNDAPEWQRASAIKGVQFLSMHPTAGPEASHESWLAQKQAEGWTYGPVKDAEKKLHPCMVPFADLHKSQQAKDHIFRALVLELLAL